MFPHCVIVLNSDLPDKFTVLQSPSIQKV